MATFKIEANIESGDKKTSPEDLTFKIYNSGVLFLAVGSDTSDSNVSLSGSTVTIINIARDDNTSYALTISQVDEAFNESLISNIINITSGPGNSFYAPGMYASGMYA